MVKSKTVFVCQECNRESPGWLGKCPACQSWNSYTEKLVIQPHRAAANRPDSAPPEALSSVTSSRQNRLTTGIGELDRVLGGGVVPGSLVLTGGEPGIGKSTLLLQAAASIASSAGKVIYISGEETTGQVKIRAQRLGITGTSLFIMAETDLDIALEQAARLDPVLLVVDSIQSVCTSEADTLPGSLNQLRFSTQRLMKWAKASDCPVFITGHVTKDGTIAGPRVLEHMVDVVCYLEGEPFQAYRILRSVKNRFGSTNEVGIFEMQQEGLTEVSNPSQIFLSERLDGSAGSAVVATLEGTRPLLVEVQALTNTTVFGQPRRVANGIDFNRLLLLTAVLSRRCGLKLGNQDVIVNVTGGINISEPAADLATALAIASSFRDQPVAARLAAVGEVGLNGELRAVPQMERRLDEAARLGFEKCIIPRKGLKNLKHKGVSVLAVATLKEALQAGLVEGAGTKSDS